MFESFIGVNFWTALFVLLNFLLLFFVAKKFLFVPVKNMIDSRQKEIDTMYKEAADANAQAQALQEEYAQRIEQAQQTSDALVREAMTRSKNREAEILQQANAQAEAIRQKAEADIARQKEKALRDAKDEISSLAVEIAGKVVGASMDSAQQQALVDGFLEELGEQV